MSSNVISRGKSKRNNILNVLSNIESSVFEGLYFNYEDESSELEESIAKRTKLRRQISDEVSKKEKMITINYLKITLSILAQATCIRI